MPLKSSYKGQKGQPVRRRAESRGGSSSENLIVVRGWREGFRKVDATKLLRGHAGFRLAEAKRVIDRILDRDIVNIALPDHVNARLFAEELRRIGAEAEMSARRRIFHVTPHAGGWSVKAEGAGRATRVFRDKKQAVAYARDVARTSVLGQLMIHRADGKLQKKHVYGREAAGRAG